MELKDVASVSGKGGLFRVLRPTRNGVILESIDEARTKFIAGANHRVSLLKEISIYTNSKEGSVPLEDVFQKIKNEFGDNLPVGGKSEPNELKGFIGKVIPDYDVERVYPSDIKKLVSWYQLLSKFAPEIFTQAPQSAPAALNSEEPTAQKETAPKKAAKSAEKSEKEDQPKAKAKATEKPEKEEAEAAEKKPAKKAATKKA